jgi:hypothetical protein
MQKNFLCTVIFLSFKENPQESAFLNQVMSAVKRLLAPASIIPAASVENEEQLQLLLNSSEVRFFVAPLKGLESTTYLWKHFNQNTHHLGQKTVLVLEDISVYMQDPQKKAALWHSLQALFK